MPISYSHFQNPGPPTHLLLLVIRDGIVDPHWGVLEFVTNLNLSVTTRCKLKTL